MTTLQPFTLYEKRRAKVLLAAKVATMMGRKLEEGDWSEVYCKAKHIPHKGWSNLHIDINHDGLGIEFKILRVGKLGTKPLRSVCGTTLMHPAATRSIRIHDTDRQANSVMRDVFQQYRSLIEDRTNRVRQRSKSGIADMRIGWLLWENELREFLYFEESMNKPNPNDYYAIWNQTRASGVRKASRSLWVFEKSTNKKRYSITTSAGIKIQPYFDIPQPQDRNLCYFCVQSERLDSGTVILWVTAETAQRLEKTLGTIDRRSVSDAIQKAVGSHRRHEAELSIRGPEAVPIEVSNEAFGLLKDNWDAVSDEHGIQLLLKSLE